VSDAEKIRAYWDQRARDSQGQPTATTNDVYMRELEHKTLVATLEEVAGPEAAVLDLGCGDGLTTLRVAGDLPGRRFLGVDYAEGMVDNARANLGRADAGVRERVRFALGDATRLGEAVGDERFDVVTTGRSLINLPTAEAQYAAIREIAGVLRPGGVYVAIENFVEGQEAMNAARAAVGLPEIPVRWHNLFFREDELRARAAGDFASVELRDFASSYYFATRVVYSAACKMRGEEPDYEHEIHRLAPDLPPTGRFSPIRLAILRKEPA